VKPPEYYKGREQTWVKHLFLEKYLERVAYNILSFKDEFVYVDGFSGPWKSEDENFEDTSFMIAVEQLRRVKGSVMDRFDKNVRIRCYFNDNDPIAFEGLKRAADEISDMEIKVESGDFEDMVPEIKDFVGRSFSLTFIDPKGWKGYGLRMIQPLLELRGEVLINFMFDYANRFLDDPRPETIATFDPVFGGPDWYKEIESRIAAGMEREEAILAVYLERLRSAGRFTHVTSTPVLKPLSQRAYFHLVYGTHHRKGLIEFRHVEKQTFPEQEKVRRSTKAKDRVERTGQTDLFVSDDHRTGPRSYEAQKQKQDELGQATMRDFLAQRGTLRFEELQTRLLEIPLVWESDLKVWLHEMRKAGEIEIPELTGRQWVPKANQIIVWKGK